MDATGSEKSTSAPGRMHKIWTAAVSREQGTRSCCFVTQTAAKGDQGRPAGTDADLGEALRRLEQTLAEATENQHRHWRLTREEPGTWAGSHQESGGKIGACRKITSRIEEARMNQRHSAGRCSSKRKSKQREGKTTNSSHEEQEQIFQLKSNTIRTPQRSPPSLPHLIGN
jgi:hypothetical protein